MVVFSANPEDYTARGKIITPLKDRIGSEIRTHYPASRQQAMQITQQEAWTERDAGQIELSIPEYVREVVEEVAFQARQDQKIDKRSGVSQRLPISLLENVVSNAERRALATGETVAVPRITDIYAAIPAITGKFELEYEGELKGADNVARELIRGAVAIVFDGWYPERRPAPGHRVVRPRRQPAGRRHAVGGGAARAAPAQVQGLHEAARAARSAKRPSDAAARLGDRLRPRGAVRAAQDQPLGRRTVPGRRAGQARRRGRWIRSPNASCRSPAARRSTTTSMASSTQAQSHESQIQLDVWPSPLTEVS